jgi:imidazolonepropionase-like amidohydrolase
MSLRLHLRTATAGERTIYLSDGRIAPEGPTDETLDLRHLYALPGLGDGHLHLAARSIADFVVQPDSVDMDEVLSKAAAQLRAGVVAAIDKGDKDGSVLAVLDEPPQRRPQLEMAGPIHRAPDGYYPGVGIEAGGGKLAGLAAPPAGADWFKIIGDWPRRGVGAVPSYTETDLRAAVGAAHSSGRRVAIHTMAPNTPTLAVRAGVDSIEHGLFLTADDLGMLGERGGFWVPTLVAMEEMVELLGADSSGGRLISSGLENIRDLLPEASRVGVKVLAGSDLGGADGAIAREAIRFVDYGLDPSDAFAAVTTSVHAAIGKPHGFSVGDPADVVCVEGDPTVDISALERVRLVIRLGRIVRRDL